MSTATADTTQLAREQRAKRLKKIRKLTGLSRHAFGEKHGISRGTLQNWETARFGGLTEKGARSCLQAFQTEGLHISFEWLMYGVGLGPQLSNMHQKPAENAAQTRTPEQDTAQIKQELATYQQYAGETLHMTVADDCMAPLYMPGQVVAGRKRSSEQLPNTINHPCIIELQDGRKFLRLVRPGSKPGHFHLLCTNIDTHYKRPVAYDIKLASAAPVVWIRTPEC